MKQSFTDIIEAYKKTGACCGNLSRICAAIDLDALTGNLSRIHERLLECGCDVPMTDVIKADGYGHGSVMIAKETEKLDYISAHAVATFEEAMELRAAGISKPIIILGYTFPYCYDELILQDLRPAVFRTDTLAELSESAARTGRPVRIHIAVDTGMSRIGIKPDESGLSFVRQAAKTPGIIIEGMFTHFARADEEDTADALSQFTAFRTFAETVRDTLGLEIPVLHCANSAAAVRLPETAMDMVRCGIIMYGLWPSDDVDRDLVRLEPVMSLHSHIVYIKDIPAGTRISYGGIYAPDKPARIATVPVGYADGYARTLTGKVSVLVRGKRVPVVGRICMDQMMLDVSSVPDAAEGDPVTLVGRDGSEEITLEELGSLSGRFNYEFACDVNKRVPRVYIRDGLVTAIE
ncbi:MAG: alanine racemase [Lachnospiraceae bacterium]|nr:alanine racemase [Lachnospiraceae bacterium]